MVPEQVRGGLVGPATHVWGIGATLYEAATDELPFNAREEPDPETGFGGGTGPGTGTFTETDMDLEAYEQLHRRAYPIRRTHRRLPAAFANAVDARLEPDPDRFEGRDDEDDSGDDLDDLGNTDHRPWRPPGRYSPAASSILLR